MWLFPSGRKQSTEPIAKGGFLTFLGDAMGNVVSVCM